MPLPADNAVDRRDFIKRASVLTLTIPGAGAMLTACGMGTTGRCP